MSIDAATTPRASAVLQEIAALLEALVCRNKAASIDLSRLALAREERRTLIDMLGAGAVLARVEAAGITEVRETAFPGAWWVTHANEQGRVLAEFIEICAVPDIVRASPEDVAEGLERLRVALKGARS